MATTTYFVALPFRRTAAGFISADVAQECPCAKTAMAAAERLATEHVGAVAFSRTLDLHSGERQDATLLRRFGDTPVLDYLLQPASR